MRPAGPSLASASVATASGAAISSSAHVRLDRELVDVGDVFRRDIRRHGQRLLARWRLMRNPDGRLVEHSTASVKSTSMGAGISTAAISGLVGVSTIASYRRTRTTSLAGNSSRVDGVPVVACDRRRLAPGGSDSCKGGLEGRCRLLRVLALLPQESCWTAAGSASALDACPARRALPRNRHRFHGRDPHRFRRFRDRHRFHDGRLRDRRSADLPRQPQGQSSRPADSLDPLPLAATGTSAPRPLVDLAA